MEANLESYKAKISLLMEEIPKTWSEEVKPPTSQEMDILKEMIFLHYKNQVNNKLRANEPIIIKDKVIFSQTFNQLKNDYYQRLKRNGAVKSDVIKYYQLNIINKLLYGENELSKLYNDQREGVPHRFSNNLWSYYSYYSRCIDIDELIKFEKFLWDETEPQTDKNLAGKKKKEDENPFKVGFLFATGKMEKFYNDSRRGIRDNYSAPAIAKELNLSKSCEKYILGTMNNYRDKGNIDKNIYASRPKMLEIIKYCEANNIEVIDKFLEKLPPE